jgi:beta-barrel assembly-enhancing protease
MANRPLLLPGPKRITRRKFLYLSSMTAAGVAVGCAINPVTGTQQFMLVSEDQEIQIDQQNAPFQFSADYGPVQDKALNDYVSEVGRNLAARTHRPQMPYSFRVVNANYVNAYAFPGGSIACTRGIMLSLDNEAELASLLGHELGHVNARHTARQMSKGTLTQIFVGGLAGLAGTAGAAVGQLAYQLGSLGAGALLASYSRDNEREADALGMEYMVRVGYGPKGMVELQDMLRNLSKNKPSTIELMFSTHPMSEERYQNAVENLKTKYSSSQSLPLYRERYMDHTAKLRSIKGAIEEMQKGEQEMAAKKYGEAEAHFQNALKQAPDDYTGLVLMATCQIIQKKNAEGIRLAERAKAVYPQEGQAHYLSGYAKLLTKEFSGAYQDFSTYEKLLPGNPTTIFFKGFSQEGMQNKAEAAKEYHRYLQIVQEGKFAQHAYQRMVEWGYYKPQK